MAKRAYIKNRVSYFVVGVASLTVSYLLGSSAIDTGSLIVYSLTLLFIGIGLRSLFIGITYGRRRTTDN